MNPVMEQKPVFFQKTGFWIALALAAHALFYFIALGNDAVDDAYISFRYAQNAIRGYGLFFNPGERVEGFTNFLWTALMVPLEGAHMDVGRASMLLGVAFALGTLWLVVRFARQIGAPQGAGLLAAFLLAADGSFALWAVAGLETTLFAFLVFAGAELYVREQSEGLEGGDNKSSRLGRVSELPFSGVFFALAAMTRPEGLLVFAVTVAHQAAWRLMSERRLVTWKDAARIGTFAALFAPYWLGRWWYYKSFLPNSFYAKVSASGPAAQLERGWNHLRQFVAVHVGWLLVLPALLAVAAAARRAVGRSDRGPAVRTRVFWTTYFAAIVVPYSAYIVYVGGDWSVGRFFVPFLAFFYLLFSTGLVDIWRWVVDRVAQLEGYRERFSGIAVSILLGAALFAFSSWKGEYGIYVQGFDAANATRAREEMGRWLYETVPPGTWIAVDAAGQVPYFSELPAIDMFGINDLHIGRLNVATLGQGTPGHEKFDLGYVITRAPTYVVIYGTLFDNVTQYERDPIAWTSDPTLSKFLTLYRRRGTP